MNCESSRAHWRSNPSRDVHLPLATLILICASLAVASAMSASALRRRARSAGLTPRPRVSLRVSRDSAKSACVFSERFNSAIALCEPGATSHTTCRAARTSNRSAFRFRIPGPLPEAHPSARHIRDLVFSLMRLSAETTPRSS
jgi:hypothetical protein